MQGLSAGEKEMFRFKAANALRDRIANAGDETNKVRLVFGSPALREKMRIIAPDAKSMATLKTFLENENAMLPRELGQPAILPRPSVLQSDVAQKHGEGLHSVEERPPRVFYQVRVPAACEDQSGPSGCGHGSGEAGCA
jgi:hypothetical protein